MAKKGTIFFCTDCGNEHAKWAGQCSACHSWNTLEEGLKSTTHKSDKGKAISNNQSMYLKDISVGDETRITTGMSELDRVLGGGLVSDSITLLGGDPGIGKSTLLLQICNSLCNESGKVMYISGEESASQIKMRAERLGVHTENLLVLSENNIEIILSEIDKHNPSVLIVDSVQTMIDPEITSAAGSVTQVREVSATFTKVAKSKGCAVFLVGHVTKEGSLAGPRVLEHIVDTVLYFEGDRYESYRILRAVKNRFGSTNEIGVFEMKQGGFEEVLNPSGLFVSTETDENDGCCVTCILEGTRPVLVEIQAITSGQLDSQQKSQYARRVATGIDQSRLNLLSVVMDKKINTKLYSGDIYANVVGGLRVDDRAADLSICASIYSSLTTKKTIPSCIYIGEVSLTGDVTPISNIDKRLSECEKLGFKNVVIPANSKLEQNHTINILKIKNISQLKDLEK